MPRPSDYTPTRRYVMQAIMWLILGGTVVLAAMVTKKQRALNHLDLSQQSVSSGNVSVRLPAKWRARPRGDTDVRVVAAAGEGMVGEGGRTLRVLTERLDVPMSPLQYLSSAFGVKMPSALGERSQMSAVSTIDIAGFPGVMITEHRVLEELLDTSDQPFGKEIHGCVVLPSLQVVVVHLSGGEAGDIGDEALVQQIGSAITIKSKPQLEDAGNAVTLAEGITLAPPKGWAALAANDAHRVDRRLWMAGGRASELPQQRERAWTVIEVVGCIFAPPVDTVDAGQRERATAEAQTLLLVRDPQRWRGATVTIEGDVYRIDPALEQNIFPLRAYLLPQRESGRAMLAVFHGGLDSEEAFDGLWKELSASVKFLPASDTAQLEDAGRAEASRLRKEDWNKLLSDRAAQWWLWTDQSDRPHIGWATVDLDAKQLAARGETRQRRWGGRIWRVIEEWNRDADGQYHAESTRTLVSGDGDDIESIRQSVNARGEQLSLTAQSRTTMLAQYRMAMPPQYVPGAALPLLMGKLAPGPMLLRTESFPGCDAIGAPRPLTLIIRPIENAPRKVDANQALRCVSAQVNGSGVVSWWYVREDSSVASVEFADGVQRVPSKEDLIGYNFGMDGQMAPKGK